MSVPRVGIVALAFASWTCGTDLPGSRECQYDQDCGAQSFCREGACLGDQVNPVVEIVSPEPGEFFATPSLLLQGRVTDGEGAGIAKCEYSLGGSSFVDLPVVGEEFSAEVALPGTDRSGLVLVVRATDRAGNQTTQSRDLAVDRSGPGIRMERPAKTAFNLSDVGTAVDASFYVSDGSKVASLEYSRDGGATWQPAQSTSALVVPLFEVLPDEAGAAHELRLRATDQVGNTTESAFTFLVDTVSPALDLKVGDETFVGKAAPNPFFIEGAVVEQQLELLRYRFDSSPASDLAWDDETGRFAVRLDLDERDDHVPHTVVVEAVDSAGNTTEKKVEVVVDRIAPTLTLASPAADGMCDSEGCEGAVLNLSGPQTLELSGRVSDGSVTGDAQLVGRIDGTRIDCMVVGLEWSCNWPIPTEDGVVRTFVVEAVDPAGNATSVTRRLYVDRVAPQATCPVDQQRLVSPPAPIVTFSEPLREGGLAAIKLNGVSAAGTLVSEDGLTYSVSDTAGLEPYTEYQVVVEPSAEDLAGNPLVSGLTAAFLSAPNPPDPTVFSGPVTSASGPVLAADPDGNPSILWWNETQKRLRISTWDGRAHWIDRHWALQATDVRPSGMSVALRTESQFATQVDHRFAAAVDSASGTDAHFGVERDGAWQFEEIQGIAPSGAPALGYAAPTYPAEDGTLVSGHLLAFLDTAEQHLRVVLQPGELPVTVLTSGSRFGLQGAALVDYGEPNRLFHAANARDTGLTVQDTITAFSGIDRVFVEGTRVGSLWTVVATIDGSRRCRLTVACAQAVSGEWRTAEMPAPCPSRGRVTKVVLGASQTRVGVGLELRDSAGTQSVRFASFPNGDCSALPAALEFEPAVASASQPAVAVGRDGKLLRAWVDSAGSLAFGF